MKLVIAILRDEENDAVSKGLTQAGFRMTMIASTGGLLRKGMSTFLIGIEDDQVKKALEVIRQSSGLTSEPGQKKGTVFVVPVDEYTRF